MTKPTKWVCPQRRLRLAWASAQTDQSSLCAQWVAKDPSFLHADSEDWSDWADAQAHLSLRWAHSFCWFCHVAAQLVCFFMHTTKTLILMNCKMFLKIRFGHMRSYSNYMYFTIQSHLAYKQSLHCHMISQCPLSLARLHHDTLKAAWML